MINDTERRALLRMMTGGRALRHASPEAIDEQMMSGEGVETSQVYKRRKVQAYIQANWKYVSTTLTCGGDCANADNPCSDAQAASCYQSNKNEVEA